MGFIRCAWFSHADYSICCTSCPYANGIVYISHHLHRVPSLPAPERSKTHNRIIDLYNFIVLDLVHFAIVTLIYVPCYASKLFSTSQINPETGEKQIKTEAMNHHDAMLFPFIGSAALVSLYLAYKFLPAYWVNLLLTTYLSLFGCVAMGESFLTVVVRCQLPTLTDCLTLFHFCSIPKLSDV